MTKELFSLVKAGPDQEQLIAELTHSAEIALRRSAKALPGDRADATRFEMLVSKIEILAERTARDDPSSELSWPNAQPTYGVPVYREGTDTSHLPPDAQRQIANGATMIGVVRPLASGDTPLASERGNQEGLLPVADIWDSEGATGTAAVTARFRSQLDVAVRDEGSICPSGVSNSVVTNVLREFATGETPFRVPVVYRDGSSGPDFPLRSIQLTANAALPERALRFSLLSIRHAEMDIEVDGAWLRNTRVSRPVPAGETDRLVYELSRRQLAHIANRGPTTIIMYQTGLETAVVGFYRAVLDQLAAAPGSLAVVPMFYRRPRHEGQRATYTEGTPWAM